MAPDTVLDVTPPAVSTAQLAHFEFSATGTVTDFKCALDGGGATRCVSPMEIQVGDGEHSIIITAFNGQVGDETPVTFAWRVDATAPDTTILSGPPAFDNSTTVTVTFSGSPETDVDHFECSLDNAAFEACTSPKELSGLISGMHTVRVRSVDSAGNPDPSPALRSWTLDTSSPDTTITAGPAADSTTGGNVEFMFTSPDATATFECKFDSGTFVACGSPTDYNSLATGSHTFEVRAKNPASGSVDPTPASRTWMVDGSAPVVQIDTRPDNPSNDTTPTFTFSSTSPDITGFECQIDGISTFAACTSPFDAGPLADASYTLRVRVTDNVGNTGNTTYTWTIDTMAPTVSITGGPMGPTSSATAVFTFASAGSPTSIRCRLDTGVLATCVSPTTYNNLADGAHTFTVTVADGAGNSSSAMRMFEVITQGPSVEITDGPANGSSISDPTPTFTFSTMNANEIDCRIDGGSFEACTSPFTTQTFAEGLHSFEVRVRDTALNTAMDSRSFTVDVTPPTVMITTGPNGPTNDTTPTFGFLTGGSPSLTQCRFDTAAFVSCASPFTALSPLSSGSHRFEVRVTDVAGNSNTDGRNFSIVTNGPGVTITTGPDGPTGDNTPSFEFTTTGGPTVIECQVDALPFATCTSPYTSSSLSDGPHEFTVRVGDVAGNQASASRAFTVDTELPMVSITGGPAGPTNDPTPTFTFVSNAPTVECRIGMDAFVACSSSYTPAALLEGSYRFEVRGSDTAGNTTNATRDFSIDVTAPTLTINARAGTLDNVTNPTQNESINDPTPLFTFTAMNFTTLECAMNGGFQPCTSGMFQVVDDLGGTPTGAGSGSLPDDHRFTVRASDNAGNVATVVRNFDVDSLAPPNASVTRGPTTTCPTGDVTGCLPNPTPPRLITNHGGQTVMAVRRVPTFEFQVPAGNWNQVACRFNTQAFTDCTPAASGAGTITYTGAGQLPEGANSLAIRVCNASFQCTTTIYNYTVDTVAPTVTMGNGPSGACPDGDGTNPTCDPTNSTTPAFTYTFAGGVTEWRCRLAAGATPSGAFEACDTPVGTQVFEGMPLLDNVRYSFGVRVYDPAFNQAEVAKNNFLVDLIAPDISLTGPNAPPAAYKGVNLPSFVFSTTNERNPQTFQCEFTNNAGVVAAWVNCTSPYKPTTAEGTYRVRVRMTDAAGNRTTFPAVGDQALLYRVDDTRPNVIITPIAASFTDGATGKLTLQPLPQFRVRIDNPSPSGVTASDIVTANTVCRFAVDTNSEGVNATGCDIVSGDYYDGVGAIVRPSTALADPAPHGLLNWQIEVHAEDRAGNLHEPVWDFTVDRTLPTLTAITLTPGTPTKTTPTATFTLVDERTGIVRNCGHDTDNDVTLAGCNTIGSFKPADFLTNGSADGTHYYRVYGRDLAGNEVNTVVSFNFDTFAPVPTINDSSAVPGPGETEPTSNRTPSFPYTITNNVPVNALSGAVSSQIASASCVFTRVAGANNGTGAAPGCRVNTTLPANGPVNASITVDPTGTPSQFTDGLYEVVLTTTDAANVGGNTASTAAFRFRVDGTRPVIAVTATRGGGMPLANGDDLNSTNRNTTFAITSGTSDNTNFTVTCAISGTTSTTPPVPFSTTTCATVTGSGTAGYTATGSFAPGALPPGSYTVTISALDTAGNNTQTATATSFVRTFTVEDDPPALNVATGVTENQVLNSTNNTPSFTITSSDVSDFDVTCVVQRITPAGTAAPTNPCVTITGTGPFTGNGTYTTSALTPGTWRVTISATDVLTNATTATTFVRNFSVDSAPPALAITTTVTEDQVLNSTNNSPSFTLAGTDASSFTASCRFQKLNAPTADTTVTCGTVSGTNPFTLSGTFSQASLVAGSYRVTISAADTFGNATTVGPTDGTFVRNFTVDSAPPALAITTTVTEAQVLNSTNNSPSFTLAGTDASSFSASCRFQKLTAPLADTTVACGTVSGTNPFTLSGTFSQASLAPGSYRLTVSAADTLLNATTVGPANGTFVRNFSVESTAPTVTLFAPVGFDSGDTTTTTNPTFTITTNDVSTLTVDCALSGTATRTLTDAVDENSTGSQVNTFGLGTPALTSGPYTLTCTATDDLGNAAAAQMVTFTVDVTPPTDSTLVGVTFADGATISDTTPTFSITTNDALSGGTVDCARTGTSTGSYADVVDFDSGPETNQFTLAALTNGTYTLTCTATDDAGNASTTPEMITFTIGPATTVAIVAPITAGATVGPSSYPLAFTVNTTVASSSTITCTMTGATGSPKTATHAAGGTFSDSFSYDGTDFTTAGSKSLTCAVTAGSGNATSSAFAFTVELTPPTLTASCPSVEEGNPVVCTFGSAETIDNAKCGLDPDPTDACDGTSTHTFSGLDAGTYTFHVTAEDIRGNVGAMTASIEVTAEPPIDPIAVDGGPDDNDVINFAPVYTFQVNAKNVQGVRCELDGARVNCPFVYPVGIIPVIDPTQGSHTVRVSIVEAPKKKGKKSLQASLKRGESDSRSFTFDSIAPEVNVTRAPQALMNDDAATVAFATKGASTTTCKVDNHAAKVCNGSLVVKTLQQGAHTIEVVAVDEAGNTAKASVGFVTDPVAVCLDGAGDHGLAAVPELTTVDGATVEMWFRTWTATDAMDLFSLDNLGTEERELAVSFEGGAFVVAMGTARVRMPVAIELDTWHHLAVEVGTNSVTLFVDGAASGTVRLAGVGAVALGDSPVLWLGMDNGAGFAPGAFADVRVSRGAVYDQAFRAVYPAEAAETTLHLFPADEGADLTSVDLMATGALSWSVPTWGTCEANPVRAAVGSGPGSVAAPAAEGMAP